MPRNRFEKCYCMATIKELLNWNLLNSVIKDNAQRFIMSSTVETLIENIEDLNKIAALKTNDSVAPKDALLDEVYYKFQSLKDEPSDFLYESFSKREVRLLVWSLDYKGEHSILFDNQFGTFISLVNKYWRDSYIIPLWYILNKNWFELSKDKNKFSEYIDLLETHCAVYDKTRKDIIAIKKHFSFWKKDGLFSFVSYILKNNIAVWQVCKELNFNSTFLDTVYYLESFIAYINQVSKRHVNDLWVHQVLEAISLQNNYKYKLLMMSTLIIKDKFSFQLPLIQKIAFQEIGDPVVKSKWSSSHLKTNEKETVESARKRLAILMNKDFIEVFFSKLVQDHRRKQYWLKFTDHIESIKFVGNRLNYETLKNIDTISKYVDSRYKITRRNQKTCALAIYAKNYVFVEFSDVGALYVYNATKFKSLFKNLNSIDKMEDLKKLDDTLIETEGDYLYMAKEGRLAHRGKWEPRLDRWMNKNFYKK